MKYECKKRIISMRAKLSILGTLDNGEPLKDLVSLCGTNMVQILAIPAFLPSNLGHLTLPQQNINMMVESKGSGAPLPGFTSTCGKTLGK